MSRHLQWHTQMGMDIVSCQESHFTVKKWVEIWNIVKKKEWEAAEIFLYTYCTDVILCSYF